MRKKYTMATVAGILAMVFSFAFQLHTYAASWATVQIYGSTSSNVSSRIGPNSSGYIKYKVENYTDFDVKWYIRDTWTGVIVRFGKLYTYGSTSGTVYGLTNRYYLYLKCDNIYSSWDNNRCNSYGWINNEY
ncbi:hypothetical protein [Shimazuella kribbensis]|uniref:hypothetical protein n=1 Tax=Shimazuella kribbensis TaxID=139808 RepID=UPI00048AA023|nr:hypothetical protein [Shimazuella kribbensis]